MFAPPQADVPPSDTPQDDQEYEDLLISVVTQIVTILTESDSDGDDRTTLAGGSRRGRNEDRALGGSVPGGVGLGSWSGSIASCWGTFIPDAGPRV